MKRALILCIACLLALAAFTGVMAKDTITADSGFRVGTDGFGFENYGQEVCLDNFYGNCFKVQNLTAAEMVRMYGEQVCKSVDANGNCTLTKAAQSWMNEINSVVSNGHCEGMAVLSSLFYNGTEKASDFGNSSVNKLTLKNNTALQREIAYWFTTQWFMEDYIIEDTPTNQVKYLTKHFNNGNGPIPLGIYQRNMSGGHAITAYAIVQHSNNIYYIMVYDNNYPNEERYITVDTNKDTWSYQTSTNTWTNTADYSGKGKTNPIQICPLEPRLGTFKCDFCNGSSSSSSSSSNPYYPYYPSDGGSSIWDILNPFMPSDSGSDYTYPTAVPDSSSSSSSIWDILSPFINPYDTGYDYEDSFSYPDSSSSSSIWDILSPFIDSGSSSSSSGTDSYVFPTQRPNSPTATPQPLVRPTAIPTAKPSAETGTESNKISVSSEINIYIEDEAGRKSGYDWENDTSYEEIPGVEVSRTMGRASAVLPNDLSYYAWMNKPSNTSKKAETFDAVITAPGRVLKLTNIVESYIYPNFIYEPPTYYEEMDSDLEFFEVLAVPNEMPGVDFTISDEYGEYNFNFTVSYKVLGKRVSIPDAYADFIIYHNYDEGDLGIAILPAEDSELSLFDVGTFVIEGSFTLWDDQGTLEVQFEQPLEMAANGMFFFNYLDWQETGTLSLEADLDGDDEWEEEWTL